MLPTNHSASLSGLAPTTVVEFPADWVDKAQKALGRLEEDYTKALESLEKRIEANHSPPDN